MRLVALFLCACAVVALCKLVAHLWAALIAFGERRYEQVYGGGKEARHPEGRGREAASGSEPRVAPGHVRTHDESAPTR
jgi:hypothetical protein